VQGRGKERRVGEWRKLLKYLRTTTMSFDFLGFRLALPLIDYLGEHGSADVVSLILNILGACKL
jgi:glycopeptide antibiotics resistance protein